MTTLLARLFAGDDGQDIVEYALLTAAIGLVGIATWPLITDALGAAYAVWDTNTQDIWEVPDPGEGAGM